MINISQDIENAIREEGQKAYPNECCGILIGLLENDKRIIKENIAIKNAQTNEEQYHRFLIEPQDLMKAEFLARKKGFDILGFYHTHPDCPAKPSQYDTERAFVFYSYIILSVQKGEAKELKSWRLSEDREFEIEEIY
ncbi:MAG: M67 family metallopeptidase [Elusimicrobiota bacterium]|jgi:proteasome lid subunit RPN8/RPN11|nr:M67 family metallopeptidase [Elusimicrobiota bacterium]